MTGESQQVQQVAVTIEQSGSFNILDYVTGQEVFFALFFLALAMLATENIKMMLRSCGHFRGDNGPRILASTLCACVTYVSWPIGIIDPLYAAIFLGSLVPIAYRPVKRRLIGRYPSLRQRRAND